MDVQMPLIDGYKCTHILRHHRPYKDFTQDIPIVAMTASAIQGDREKCKRAGMDDYLAKPVKSNILERMLVRWTKSRRTMSRLAESIDNSVSDCSESGDQCDGTGIPRLGVGDEETSEGGRPGDEFDPQDDRHNNLPTPRPLAMNKSTEVTTFPFEPNGDGCTASQPSRQRPQPIRQPSNQLDTKELAAQLRTEKLIDVAGGDAAVDSHVLPGSLVEGDSLTQANVEKLQREVSSGRFSS